MRLGICGLAALSLCGGGAFAQESTTGSGKKADPADTEFFCLYDNLSDASVGELATRFFNSDPNRSDKLNADMKKAEDGCIATYHWDAGRIAIQKEIAVAAAVVDSASVSLDKLGFKGVDKLEEAIEAMPAEDARALLKDNWRDDLPLVGRVRGMAQKAGVPDKPEEMGGAMALTAAYVRGADAGDRWESYRKN